MTRRGAWRGGGGRLVARGCGPGPSAALGGFSLGNRVFPKGGCTETQLTRGHQES